MVGGLGIGGGKGSLRRTARILYVSVQVCVFEAQKVFYVRHPYTHTYWQENKQNLYSLNRMTLYKFSCAPQWGCVCVCECECLCGRICVSGWQLGRIVNKQKKKKKSFLSPYMYKVFTLRMYLCI